MIRSLLKWPGGKSRVMPELLPHLPKAGCLVEPFVGGASVFLNTDYRRYILADINPDLIRLYREVKSNPELVIDLARPLFATGNSKEEYLQNRRIFNGTKGLLDVVRCEFGIRLVFQHSHCTFPQTCNAVENIVILFTILQVQHILIKRVLCPW